MRVFAWTARGARIHIATKSRRGVIFMNQTTRLYYSNSRLRGKIWHEYTAEIGKLLPLVYEPFIRSSDFHWRSGSSSLLLSLVGTKLQWICATLKHLQLHSCHLTDSYASRVLLAEEPQGHHSQKDFYGTVLPEQAVYLHFSVETVAITIWCVCIDISHTFGSRIQRY